MKYSHDGLELLDTLAVKHDAPVGLRTLVTADIITITITIITYISKRRLKWLVNLTCTRSELWYCRVACTLAMMTLTVSMPHFQHHFISTLSDRLTTFHCALLNADSLSTFIIRRFCGDLYFSPYSNFSTVFQSRSGFYTVLCKLTAYVILVCEGTLHW